jgi:thiamine pyrophosphate-dependent acetolactate synthase large subunit-like protein
VPLFAVMGDGAVGAGGMDIETNVRWDIPCVFMHHNNNNLVTGGWDLFLSKVNTPTGNPMLDGWATLPNIRYDRMFREFGCHTEFVEKDEELKPAMKRAFDFVRDQSKPAFIEVFVDPDTLQEIWNVLIGVIGVDVEWDELPEKGQEVIKRLNLVSPAFAPLTHPTWWPHIGLA